MLLRNTIAIVVTLGLTLTFNIQLSLSNGSPQWVTGEVASIVETGGSGLISLKLSDGELVSISSKSELLRGLKSGDIVTIQIVEGLARIIQVAESKPAETPKPEVEKRVQWVTGELVSIQRGTSDSLLSIKMWDGTVFNVAASNDKIEGVEAGDSVIAKVVDGWAESVSKKGR